VKVLFNILNGVPFSDLGNRTRKKTVLRFTIKMKCIFFTPLFCKFSLVVDGIYQSFLNRMILEHTKARHTQRFNKSFGTIRRKVVNGFQFHNSVFAFCLIMIT